MMQVLNVPKKEHKLTRARAERDAPFAALNTALGSKFTVR